ncbi:hypothetical protein P280DRAFT_269030 [Massarina eburnea CBS 473.64]|uniref:Uncharacterized protein n=1 Tax=Massarina eburnea CBS 473.64 TaxID=1395130 RepID=A0A6A6S5Y4_9PLEO|nr:hypothetical protein P280DRAFT_269030 [Massarina eburnea CBS 473.64]
MAPPGFAPPSYSHDRIPTRLVNKEHPPEGTDTNGRAYFIFFSYLGLAVSLTTLIVLRIFKSYSILLNSTTAQIPSKKHVRMFVALAIWSVLMVWYYEMRYFSVSYKSWMMWRSYYDLTPDQMHWGLWLKETSLFKEAWETAVVGNARYWWTNQIFFFACGLGLSLEQRGKMPLENVALRLTTLGIRRGIKHTWAFMLLGQVCSVSFATNLYLIALLVSPPPPPSPSSVGIYRRKWLGPWLMSLLMIIFTEGPAYLLADEHYWFHQTDFLPMIVTPHVALLVLPIARALLPGKFFTDSSVEFAGTVYTYLWSATIFGGGLLIGRMTALSYAFSGFRGIWDALLENPAVSSIAFDVIFCWVTWAAWLSIQKRSEGDVLGFNEDEDEKADDWAAGSTRVASAGDESGVRRR